MKRIISSILLAVLACLMLGGCSNELNYDQDDIRYNDIVYERTEYPNYNIVFIDDNEKYIGDFLETYDYGQQLLWEVYMHNEEGGLLYSAHAAWIKPGYVFPDEYGEPFKAAEYVVSDGILDEYWEEVTPLITFTEEVKLEDIIEAEKTEITEHKTYGYIRLLYRDFADVAIDVVLAEAEGVHYLIICKDATAEEEFFRIKDEYVELLTRAAKDGDTHAY